MPITLRAHGIDEASTTDRKPQTSPSSRRRQPSTDDGTNTEKIYSIAQLTMNFAKKHPNDTIPSSISGMVRSDTVRSFQDIFSTESTEQAKDMILNGIRSELYRSRATSESGSEDYVGNRTDSTDKSTRSIDERTKTNSRKTTMLLAGPKFRRHTVEPEVQLKRDTIYPIVSAVGFFTILITLWKPISPFVSGIVVGFILMTSLCYILTRMYMNAKADETVVHEWINFPELITQDENKKMTSYTCAEIIFGRYDADSGIDYVRYPVVARLDNYNLRIELPTNAKEDETKDKEVRFIGHREYFIKEAKIMLVPEATLSRMKYWVDDYPIIIQDLKMLDKQIYNQEYFSKSKFDTKEFFNNSQTVISLFLETGPDKEDWFHKLSLVLRRGKEEVNRAVLASMGTPSASSFYANEHTSSVNMLTKAIPDTQIPTFGTRASDMQANIVRLEDRVQMKSTETIGPPYPDIAATEKTDVELLRSQINGGDILNDMAHGSCNAFDLRNESLDKDKDKRANEKDGDKDSIGSRRTGSMRKKLRKQEESIYRLLDSPDILDEAAITLNFVARRLLCDVFEEPLFKDLMKEKVELKLKEIAVSVLEDLHVETIDLGNTFPVILKIEPMQWNHKGIWFNLFFFYRGSFKITIKTRLVLQRLLNYNPTYDQPIYAQHHAAQSVHKADERVDDDDLVHRQKLLAKEPEIPENAASRKLGALLTKVASNKHFQRFAALKPVAGVIEKISNAEVGVKIELTSFSGIMTINIPPPPSDRLWIGFPEMPNLNLKVTPVFGESKYSYTLIHDFLEARIRDELKRMVVLPAMDDQLLPFFRDWVIDVIGEIASKPANPLIDSYKSQTSFRDILQNKNITEFNRTRSKSPENLRTDKNLSTLSSIVNLTNVVHENNKSESNKS